jgi:hypothetical protein
LNVGDVGVGSAEASALTVGASGKTGAALQGGGKAETGSTLPGVAVDDPSEPGSIGEAAAIVAERLRAEAGRQGEREAGAALAHSGETGDRNPLTHLKVRNVQRVDGMLVLTLSAVNTSRALIGATGLAASDVVLIRPITGAARHNTLGGDSPKNDTKGGDTSAHSTKGMDSPARRGGMTRRLPLGERRRMERREAAARELGGRVPEGAGLRGVVRRISDYSIGVALEGEAGLPGEGGRVQEEEEEEEEEEGRMSPEREARLFALARSIMGEAVRGPIDLPKECFRS